jgi:CDP-diacylglycerol--serine O-phosphatidyltransferase
VDPTRYRLLAPNAVTAANIAAGFLAIIAAADGRFELAVYVLLLAIILDMCDGSIARRLGATSEFGQEMDSFSDALSFGAAPAVLVYLAILKPLGFLGLLASVSYLLTALLGLTRFVLTTDAHRKERRTVGVPVPIAASYLMAMTLMRDQMPATAALVVTAVFSLLMISHVHLPNLKGRNVVTLMLLIGIVNYLAVVFLPSWYSIGWWNIWNACILVVAGARERRLKLVAAE